MNRSSTILGRFVIPVYYVLGERIGDLRRTRASRLTAARDLQDLRDIEMRFQMIGERVQRGFYAGLVGQRRREHRLAGTRKVIDVEREVHVHATDHADPYHLADVSRAFP